MWSDARAGAEASSSDVASDARGPTRSEEVYRFTRAASKPRRTLILRTSANRKAVRAKDAGRPQDRCEEICEKAAQEGRMKIGVAGQGVRTENLDALKR